MKIMVKAVRRVGRYRPGDEFPLSRTDANAYIRLGIVEECAGAGSAPTLTTAALAVEEPEAVGAPSRNRRRAYKRRDLQAED